MKIGAEARRENGSTPKRRNFEKARGEGWKAKKADMRKEQKRR